MFIVSPHLYTGDALVTVLVPFMLLWYNNQANNNLGWNGYIDRQIQVAMHQ